jgi:hypothetical protein
MYGRKPCCTWTLARNSLDGVGDDTENVYFCSLGDSVTVPAASFSDKLQPVQMGKATKGKH